ncbi:hypothetical protein [Pelagibacterium sp. H642]|uniref:hypothetical protein n=1 Tax=Pelagibacterium sp. H642 TaxID=1881069 RepID=UPI002814D033|nr:hypothetical protein [Pelagibacterium sp. H642]WMT90100.1 hypothetical protein NO934_15075 [Pelagibacterium sp. H642]
MSVPHHIRRAARIIRRYFIVPHRQRKLARAMGVDDLTTKFAVAKRRHQSTKAIESQIKAACIAKLRSEVHG